MNKEPQTVSELRAIPRDEHCPAHYDRAVTYTLDQRIDGLNQAARARGELFKYKETVNGKKINQGLINFIDELNDVTNNRKDQRQNKRVIHLIYVLAGIQKERHTLNYDQLNPDEQTRLVEAMNQLKAVSALFPTDLAIK